ncbi:hypothetical protein BGW39_011364 [Mortierella sp. 14UC]|nr:hypothetical protein BGW39_011364 [Mortierella sp. 14UC]
MHLFSSNKPSDNNNSSRKTLSMWTLFSVLVLLSAFLASNTSSTALAAPSGFCAECQTYAMVIQPCGGTFTPETIEIQTPYNPPQAHAQCVCKAVIQRLLWNCARCENLSGFAVKTPPPSQYQTTCTKEWGVAFADYTKGYTGDVAPGTLSPLTGDNGTNPNPNVVKPPLPTSGTNPSTGSGNGTTGTSSGAVPTNSDGSTSGAGESTGPNGTAIGISLGIIGVAAVAGVVAVVMMKRRRRRHTPLELDGTYVGLDDQWEKPARPQTPPMMPAPIVNGGRGGGGGGGLMRPSPFESRPPGSVSGGGSVVGGYDNSQYDQYDYHQGGGGSTVVGSNYGDYDDGYGKQQHGGYNQGYNQGYPPHDQGYPPHHDQGYPPHHDYGYDHPVPTSGAPYHGGR